MRFLCDVHISYQLVKYIQKLGFECEHVNTLPNKWHKSDAEICNYVDAHDCILITKNPDFKNTHFIKQTPKKLIRTALGNISNQQLIALFDANMQHIGQAMKATKCSIEVNDSYIEKNED